MFCLFCFVWVFFFVVVVCFGFFFSLSIFLSFADIVPLSFGYAIIIHYHHDNCYTSIGVIVIGVVFILVTVVAPVVVALLL